MMGSAFDWSPGGCCCNASGGWWEEWAFVGLEVIHNGSHPTPGTPDPTGTNGFYYRVGSMAPKDVGIAEYDSWSHNVAYQPEIPIESLLWFRGEDTRWAIEQPSNISFPMFAAYAPGGGPINKATPDPAILRVPFSQFTGFASMPEPTNYPITVPNGIFNFSTVAELLSVNVNTLAAWSFNPGDAIGEGYIETTWATVDGGDGYTSGPQQGVNFTGPGGGGPCARVVIADTNTGLGTFGVRDTGVNGVCHIVSKAVCFEDVIHGGSFTVHRTPFGNDDFDVPTQIHETTTQLLCAVSPHWNLGASIRSNTIFTIYGGGTTSDTWVPSNDHRDMLLEFSVGPVGLLPVSRSGGNFWGVNGDAFLTIHSNAKFGMWDNPDFPGIKQMHFAGGIGGRWMWFDSDGGTWAGVIEYLNADPQDDITGVTNDNTYGSNYYYTQALYINGREIKKITYAFATMTTVSAAVHPCIGLPHVVKNGGLVAVVQIPFDPEPHFIQGMPGQPGGDNVRGEGNSEPIAKAARDPILNDDFYKLVIYEAATGSKIYTSPDMVFTTILGSTERWIYVATDERDSIFTKGKFQDRFQGIDANGFALGPPGTPSPRGGPRVWLVSHNGVEVIPTGTLTIDPTIVFGDLFVWHFPVETEPPRFVTYDTPVASGTSGAGGADASFYFTSEYFFARSPIPIRSPYLWTLTDIMTPPDNFSDMFDAHLTGDIT